MVVLAEDRGDWIRHLSNQDIARLARPFVELLAIAVENLRTIAPVRYEDLGSVLMLTSGADYEASLALDKELIADIGDKLGGAVIFAIPGTDGFLIGRKGQAAIEAMARGIGMQQIRDGKSPLSSSIYEYRDDELMVLAQVEVVEGRIVVSMVGEE